MPGVPREFAKHSLNVFHDIKPVKQTLRRFADDRRQAIGEEITRLLAAGFIKEVFHSDWLANPVPRTRSLCSVLIKSSTLRPAVSFFVFWMPI